MIRILIISIMLLAGSAQATDWATRFNESKLGFTASQGGADFEGVFKKFSSKISFDPNDLSKSSVQVIIDIASVDSQNADRDKSIQGADWFDTAKHPTAVFETISISERSKGQYTALANLTMRGVTKKVELPFTVSIDGGTAHAKGELVVSRTEYGIGQGQWAASSVVGDRVRIFFDLQTDAQ